MKQLSYEDCLNIAKLISTFRGCVTWPDIIDLGEEVTGVRFSRVTLAGKDSIRLAYDMARRKGEWSGGKQQGRRKSKAIALADDRYARVVAVSRTQEALIAQLNEQFVVWMANARKHGVSEADLNAELSWVDRGGTEDPAKKGKGRRSHEKGDERPNGRR